MVDPFRVGHGEMTHCILKDGGDLKENMKD